MGYTLGRYPNQGHKKEAALQKEPTQQEVENSVHFEFHHLEALYLIHHSSHNSHLVKYVQLGVC